MRWKMRSAASPRSDSSSSATEGKGCLDRLLAHLLGDAPRTRVEVSAV